MLATISSYSFARLIGAGRLGAVYAGLAFGVSGYLLARSQALGLLTGAAWLAATVAAAQYAVRREGRGASPLVVSAALALSILGGSQQLTAVAATSALLLLVLQLRWRGLAVFAGAGGGRRSGSLRWRSCPASSSCRSRRRPTGWSIAAGIGTLQWSDANLLFGSFGTHAGELAPLYAGALTPALVVVALIRRWSEARVPLALALLAILWSAGLAGFLAHPFGPLRSITAHQAVRALPLLALAIAALAGLAFGRPGSRPSPWLVAGLAVVIALLVQPDVLLHRIYVVPAVAMLAVLFLLRSRRGAAAVVACALVPCVLAADLARHDYSQQNPHQPAANWEPAAEAFPSAARDRSLTCWRAGRRRGRRALHGSSATSRARSSCASRATPTSRDYLLDSAATRYGLEDVAGYDPLQLLAYRDAIAASNDRTPSDRHFLWVDRAPTDLLRRLGVRYYVAAPKYAPPGMPVVLRTPRAVIVRDDRALPLARVNRPGRTDAARIVRARARPRRDRHAGRTGRPPRARRSGVSRLGRQRRRARAVARKQAGLFRAVDVPAGRHRVEWRFEPRSVRTGLIISLATLAAAVAYAIFARRRSAQSRDEGLEALGVERRRRARADREGHDAAARRERRQLVPHALDAPAAGRREAGVGRQARVEHVGVDVHVERRVAAGARPALPRRRRTLVQLRAVDALALSRDRGRGRPRARRAARAAGARGPPAGASRRSTSRAARRTACRRETRSGSWQAC